MHQEKQQAPELEGKEADFPPLVSGRYIALMKSGYQPSETSRTIW